MRDIEDDDLVLHHYGEADAALAARIDAALAADPALAARWRALKRTLAAADAMPVPDAPADYGARTWAAVADRLGPQRRAPRAGWIGLAAASLAALGVMAWYALPRAGFPPAAPTSAAPEMAFTPAARERVLVARVAHHLDGSQRLFASVSNAEPARTDLAEVRTWASRALSANRIYRNAAAAAGEKRMVALLDAMEPLLIEIANAPETMSAEELAFIQRRIAEADLLFRLRSAQQRLENRANPEGAHPVQRPRRDI